MKYRNLALKIYKTVASWRDKILKRPAKLLISWGVNADMITLSRLVLVLPMFFLVGWSPAWVIVILLINYYILDAIDGVVARESGKSSLRGRTLDLCVDHFYIIPLVLALIFYNVSNAFLASLYLVNLLIDYFVKYLRFGIEVGKYPFTYSKFFVYFTFLVWSLNIVNVFDPVFVFFAIYLFVTNVISLKSLYYGN